MKEITGAIRAIVVLLFLAIALNTIQAYQINNLKERVTKLENKDAN